MKTFARAREIRPRHTARMPSPPAKRQQYFMATGLVAQAVQESAAGRHPRDKRRQHAGVTQVHPDLIQAAHLERQALIDVRQPRPQQAMNLQYAPQREYETSAGWMSLAVGKILTQYQTL